MSNISDKLIVALDVDSIERAEYFVKQLRPEVHYFKIGAQLFTAAGHAAIAMVAKHSGRVFLDSKFYDIPNTVYQAVSMGTASSAAMCIITGVPDMDRNSDLLAPVFMMTVHTMGGKVMLQRAAAAAREKAQELNIKKPYVVGVTVLTSDLPTEQTPDVVLARAQLADEAGLDGVVCSAHETMMLRKKFPDFIIVNPGIRPKNYPDDDQKRTATAQEALDAGADFIVVGRPILQAKDPLAAVRGLI